MPEAVQTAIVAAIVMGAFAYLWFRSRKKAGCGKGCDCPTRKQP